MKDLELLISSNLSWNDHINVKLTKANRTLHFMMKNIPFSCPIAVRAKFYKLCVLPSLLYASQVWSPSLCCLRKTETFHKRALRWVTRRQDHLMNLKTTRCLPISYYIIFYDLCFFNKLLHRDYDLDPFRFLSLDYKRVSGKPELRPFFLCNHRSFKRITDASFFQRITRSSNYITKKTDISLFSPPTVFKSQIRIYLTERIKLFAFENSCTWYLKCICSNCRL